MEKGVLPAGVALTVAIVLIGLSGEKIGSQTANSETRITPSDQVAAADSSLAPGGRFVDRERPSARRQEAGQAAMAAVDPASKASIGARAIALESSLEAARQQLNGLKAQVALANEESAMTDFSAMNALRAELDADLKAAGQGQVALRSQALKFPALASSSQFADAQAAIDQLRKSNQGWQARAKGAKYWRSGEQVKKDLDSVDSDLVNALDKAKSFGSTVSSGG